MANQQRLEDNRNDYEAGHRGAARKGVALPRGVAVCGRCGRRMTLRYSGPRGDYPVYCCRADRDQTAGGLCQEVRALAVDDLVSRVLLEALAPDNTAIAIATVDQMTAEARQLERQWSLKRERDRFEAERARRQYDAVEPENRLVARSLERVWEERLRAGKEVEDAYRRWRREDPIVLRSEDLKALEALARDLPVIWNAATTQADEKKRIPRLIIQEVLLDQKSDRGQVKVKIIWQTGAISEHKIARHVRSYTDYAAYDLLQRRITELNANGPMDKQIAALLNKEGIASARRCPFTYENIWLLGKRWGFSAVKLNPVGANPARWPDGSYPVQGAASALGVTPQTIFDYLARGVLSGRQITKGQPWQIDLSVAQIADLRERLRHTNRSRRTAP